MEVIFFFYFLITVSTHLRESIVTESEGGLGNGHHLGSGSPGSRHRRFVCSMCVGGVLKACVRGDKEASLGRGVR